MSPGVDMPRRLVRTLHMCTLVLSGTSHKLARAHANCDVVAAKQEGGAMF